MQLHFLQINLWRQLHMRPTILIQYQPILPALGSIGTSVFSLLCHGWRSQLSYAATFSCECSLGSAHWASPKFAFYATAARRVTAGAAQRGSGVCDLSLYPYLPVWPARPLSPPSTSIYYLESDTVTYTWEIFDNNYSIKLHSWITNTDLDTIEKSYNAY